MDSKPSITLKKDDVLCLEGDEDYDLYTIITGKLLVCVTKGSQVSPIAYLNPGEFFGELSFFDKAPRSANVVCVEDATLEKISLTSIKEECPRWIITLAKAISKKIRHSDEIIAKSGLRKKNVEHVKAFSIEEQTHLYQLLKNKS